MSSSSPNQPSEAAPVVRMRNKTPLTQTQEAANGVCDGDGSSALQRGLDVLNEMSPELEDGSDEIRKLDSQLDHLNHYMDKVEQRIRTHNAKLMDTLKHQKEEREKRRRSFHERLLQTQQEDDDFKRQIANILNRVDISKNRASVYDLIRDMEVPKANVK